MHSTIEQEREIEHSGILLRAAEDWGPSYSDAPGEHAKLVIIEGKYETALRKFFRDMADQAEQLVDWNTYRSLIRAAAVQVEVNEVPIAFQDDTFFEVSLDFIITATTLGAQSGEVIYNIPLGIESTDAIMQRLGKEHVASLVGKKVLSDGSIVDAPKSSYRITDKVRTDIVESIKTSIALGEDTDTAIERMRKVIRNPVRAAIIAQTEIVNGYQNGLDEFGRQSGAVGKEIQDVGAVDRCATYANLGPVPFDYEYEPDRRGPTFHPRCRCSKRLIYQEEWDSLQKNS